MQSLNSSIQAALLVVFLDDGHLLSLQHVFEAFHYPIMPTLGITQGPKGLTKVLVLQIAQNFAVGTDHLLLKSAKSPQEASEFRS
ncbi:MAG: hypothetical protein AB1696_22800 [Planctomycetota bacterium]